MSWEDTFMVGKALSANLGAEIKNLNNQVDILEADNKYLLGQIEALTLALTVEKACFEAKDEELKQWAIQHPDSPLLATDQYKYMDGSPKSISRKLFEIAFDKAARALGITDPAQYRRG